MLQRGQRRGIMVQAALQRGQAECKTAGALAIASLAGHKARPLHFPYAVEPVAKEFEEAEVAEDLHLLADFVADIGIFRMELR